MNKKRSKIKKEDIEDKKSKENLVGFFDLLIQIDKRNNPELYEDNRGSNKAD